VPLDDRYTVISADCHAGGDIGDYRQYLDSRYLDEFDAWAAAYVNPYADLTEPDAGRNWDSERRNSDLDGQGIAGEVIFPIRCRRSSPREACPPRPP